MSVSDCYIMGILLFKSERFYYSSEWLNEALKRHIKLEFDFDNFTLEILRNLVESYVEQRKFGFIYFPYIFYFVVFFV